MTTRTTQPQDRSRQWHSIWSDRAWPVLAGALSAVGLLGGTLTFGVLGLLLLGLGVWLFTSLTVYGALSESGFPPARCVRIGLVAAVALIVLTGLLLLAPVLGAVTAGVLVVTSPLVTDRVSRLGRRHRGLFVRQAPAPRRDQGAVDRAFLAMTRELGDDRSGGSESS